MMSNPNNTRPRAVFSTNDFELLKRAVLFYSQKNYENMTLEEASNVSSLMHRLGRIQNETPREWR